MTRTLALLLGAALASTSAYAAPVVPSFPGVPPAPLSAQQNFGGFFAHHQPVKIVFGVSHPRAQLKETLTNLALMIRYLKSKGYRYHMQVVLYGRGVFAADQWKTQYSVYHDLMRSLHGQGVQFRVCYNSMYALHVKSDDLYSWTKVVPAGILQLAKKQMQGYSYVVNP
ncbi:MAG TPA: DsrE family protein [Acidiferrobacteraceae bacterium]|nr:DsrE family protein [Acidiferrobacteraceae bacterium]